MSGTPAPDRIPYAEALRLARYCVSNRSDEDRLQGYDISADKLDDAEAALRALAALCERAERAAPQSLNPLIRDLALGYQPPRDGGDQP